MHMQSCIRLHVLPVLEGKPASRKHSVNIHRNAEEERSYNKLVLTSYGHSGFQHLHPMGEKSV